MARVELQITRRTFLKSSMLGAVALSIQNGSPQPVWEALTRMNIPVPWYKKGQIKTTYNYCDVCLWRCGVVVKTVNGKVQKIDGNPNDPKSRGMLCARGQAGPSFMYDPDRLRSPMIRTGERGEGKFKEVSWSEALDYIAGKMNAIKEQYGQESIAFFGHTSGDFWFTEYLPQAWGSPNAAKPSSSLCTSPREEAAQLTLGRAIGGHEPVDWDASRCLVLIGTHIGENAHNTMMQDFANAKARGVKIIVVDPRFSTAAMKADYWLPIKPGTDTALLLAWMNVLIGENRYDQEYIETWTEGFDRLAEHVKQFTPEWAAAITDIPAETIRTTARVMADTLQRTVIVPGRHVTWYGNDTQRMRSVYLINALLGAWGNEGGLYFGKAPYIEAYPHPPFAVEGGAGGCSAAPGDETETALPLGPSGKHRADGVRDTFMRGATAMQELVEPMISGKPYPIKGLFAYGVNLFHTIPDVERTKQALANLDLIVAIDVLPQDHIPFADVVLPEATYLERYDELWTCSHKTPYITFREPAVEPLYDSKPGWWMARELGLRLGLEKYFKWETAEEYLNTRLATIGYDLDKLRAEGGVIVQKGKPYFADFTSGSPFGTPTGKIQLYSETLALAGHDPLPVYEEIEQPPTGFFRLLYGRHPVHTFAKTQNTPVLHEIYPENEVWINAEAAAGIGVKGGDYVWLKNQDGSRSGPVKVKATQRIRQDAVYMVHGFGHTSPQMALANGRGASDTALQSRYKLDPISGGAGMRINFVTIEKEA